MNIPKHPQCLSRRPSVHSFRDCHLSSSRSPVEKLHLTNAFVKQLIKQGRDALKAQPKGALRQSVTKIQLRVEALANHIKVLAEGKEKVSSAHLRPGNTWQAWKARRYRVAIASGWEETWRHWRAQLPASALDSDSFSEKYRLMG